MEFVQAMWLPIVVSGVFVWIASFLMWMVLPFHKGEWQGVPNEKGFMGALTEMGVQPGAYMFPHMSTPERMKEPDYQEMLKRGPTGIMTVWNGPPKMGLYMVVTLFLYLVVSLFVAYVAAHTLSPSDPYLSKFRITGAMAIAIYTLGKLPHDVWFRTPQSSVVRQLVDGVVYGLVTAGTFGWLWKA